MVGFRASRGLGFGYFVYLLALSLWVSLIFLAPILSSAGYQPLASPIYTVFSATCHQRAERCIYLHGRPMAVCARCTFIYLGVLAASLVHPLLGSPRAPRIRYLLLAAAPLIFDGGTQLIGLRESTNPIRAMTGLVFGVALALHVAPEAEETVYMLLSRIRKRTASQC